MRIVTATMISRHYKQDFADDATAENSRECARFLANFIRAVAALRDDQFRSISLGSFVILSLHISLRFLDIVIALRRFESRYRHLFTFVTASRDYCLIESA